ncbi:C4-dicarboxylate ABC transporter substrate-binding protein [Roseivivax halodurans JCM 10272]|uniref:C4-dicarboxylate ABC transporter substrate-binding protein n=2 Tax=Roseivivax halodurans TaxID=93683 RepID=X7E4X1_9RHOB|nr:C4-dicarboxylate ABC transporter substrate-binding protein [Roseivivax halodurans JCM 10272]
MAACGQTLTVRESAGSLENFLGVRNRPATQFGIVQSDVLEYFQTYSANDPAIARAIQGVRIAFPLYNEEVHLLARRDIATTADLDGMRVAVGVADSGTFLTASLLMDLLGVTPAETLTIGPDASLEQLLAGEIDAFFYVAGAPTAIFETEAISAEDFHLVEITDEVLASVYLPTEIPAGTYPFQDEEVEVVAVKAVLMTYDYNPARNRYHADSCKAVSDVSNLILTQFDTLRANGHPKWQRVDLNEIPPGWDIGTCVNVGLAPNYPLACSRPMETEMGPENPANSIYRARICETIGC